MECQGEMGFYGEQFDPNNILGRERDDSGSDNNDTLSVDEHEGGNKNTRGRRKRYHRHTPQQIQELENFFKNCAHPDEKQRLELGRRLGLESRQVKFWFQNRRTQMKTQLERHENVVLKQEYDKLRMENIAMKDAMRTPVCQNCGGAAMFGEISMDENQLRIENARLKDELSRVCAITEKFLGKPISEFLNAMSSPMPSSNLELSMGRSLFPGVMPMGLNLENGVSSNPIMAPPTFGLVSNDYEKTMYLQVAMAAMDELIAMAQTDSPLWFKGMDGGKEVLNHDEYVRKFSPCIGMKPGGFITDATRETGSVFMSSLELVDSLMFSKHWQDMFPCMIVKASTVEMLCNGVPGSHEGELQLINAEFVYPSPLVPVRQAKFLRYCKQHSHGMWAIVDVSVDALRESSHSDSVMKWRRLPSGCIVQDVTNGHSLVTWIEHVEYEESSIHHLYQNLVSSGLAFGAARWLATLQRERECSSIFMSLENQAGAAINLEGRRSILKLTKRISNNFCAGLCASPSQKWEKLRVDGLSEDVRVMTRISVNEPGEPSGVVLSVATSVWMPVLREHLFAFLRDERSRSKWDILSNGGPMEVMASLPKSHDGTSCISVLCPPATPSSESNMLILQDSWTDKTCSFIVYVPVDAHSIESVMHGGDSDFLALLPSGFSISDGFPCPNPTRVGTGSSGSVLTLGFQILVNNLPTAKLTVESIETVNNLVSCTIQRIKGALLSPGIKPEASPVC